jgi:hypothetical protein
MQSYPGKNAILSQNAIIGKKVSVFMISDKYH